MRWLISHDSTFWLSPTYENQFFYYLILSSWPIQVTENATSAVSPFHSKFNLVGPKDYKSNIRKVIYAKSKDENASVRNLHLFYSAFFEVSPNDHFPDCSPLINSCDDCRIFLCTCNIHVSQGNGVSNISLFSARHKGLYLSPLTSGHIGFFLRFL